MNVAINTPRDINDAVAGKCYGRSHFTYKYTIEVNGLYKKYCSITDMIKDEELAKYNLNRQKVYRIRSKSYSTKTGTSATALIKKGYGNIIITQIKEHRPFKVVISREFLD